MSSQSSAKAKCKKCSTRIDMKGQKYGEKEDCDHEFDFSVFFQPSPQPPQAMSASITGDMIPTLPESAANDDVTFICNLSQDYVKKYAEDLKKLDGQFKNASKAIRTAHQTIVTRVKQREQELLKNCRVEYDAKKKAVEDLKSSLERHVERCKTTKSHFEKSLSTQKKDKTREKALIRKAEETIAETQEIFDVPLSIEFIFKHALETLIENVQTFGYIQTPSVEEKTLIHEYAAQKSSLPEPQSVELSGRRVVEPPAPAPANARQVIARPNHVNHHNPPKAAHAPKQGPGQDEVKVPDLPDNWRSGKLTTAEQRIQLLYAITKPIPEDGGMKLEVQIEDVATRQVLFQETVPACGEKNLVKMLSKRGRYKYETSGKLKGDTNVAVLVRLRYDDMSGFSHYIPNNDKEWKSAGTILVQSEGEYVGNNTFPGSPTSPRGPKNVIIACHDQIHEIRVDRTFTNIEDLKSIAKEKFGFEGDKRVYLLLSNANTGQPTPLTSLDELKEKSKVFILPDKLSVTAHFPTNEKRQKVRILWRDFDTQDWASFQGTLKKRFTISADERRPIQVVSHTSSVPITCLDHLYTINLAKEGGIRVSFVG